MSQINYYTYILKCKNGSYYTGYTNDIDRRMRLHEEGRGSKMVRAMGFDSLMMYWTSSSKSAAMKLEAYIKKQTKAAKDGFIKNPDSLIELCPLSSDYEYEVAGADISTYK